MNPDDQRRALKAAAQWHARLCTQPQCPQTVIEWNAWREADSVHGWAWQQLEALLANLQGVSGPLARHTLASTGAEPGRRMLLKGLLLGVGISGLGWAGYHRAPLWLADARTATGQRRQLTLDDGTRVMLNTGTAVDIQYTAGQRLIVLIEGEIFVETAADARPMLVRTPHGDMRPLGTRFNVRLYPEHTALTVIEHAVEVRNRATGHAIKVAAGMRLVFDDGVLSEPQRADLGPTEWHQGRLVLDDCRLDSALAELQRYRVGVLRCSEDVAGLRLSGVYPLENIDRVLAAIAHALKLEVQARTRFWVTLTAAR